MSVVVIAEAGVNHNGSMENAKKLIDAAVEAGADYVKFQTFKAKNLASKFAAKAIYQQKTTSADESQLEMLKKLELADSMHHELIAYCNEKKIAFLSTPFDIESIEFLKSIGITTGKIPSGELTNLPYLRKMAGAFSKLILSTGMATMDEVEMALQILIAEGKAKSDIVLLHCTTEYPSPIDEVNLNAMVEMGKKFNIAVGYSDHTLGIEVPVAAVALGATLIEKHFTLDKKMEGPDHVASLEPNELKAMVAAIRNIERALGDGIKKPTPSEIKNIAIARKSIVAARDIKKGDILSEDNIGTKRPGTGISPMEWDNVIGTVAIQDFKEDEMIAL